VLPDEIRRLRLAGETQTDLWDASACGLVQGERLTNLLNNLRTGPAGIPETLRDPGADALCYIVRDPSYVPFTSKRISRYAEADRMSRDFLRVAFSAEATESVVASPLGATAMVAAASIRKLSIGPAGRALKSLSSAVPPKGGEVDRLVLAYHTRHAQDIDHAPGMVIRDFYAHWYALVFIRSRDGHESDLCASVMCTATAVDYVNSRDAASNAGHDVHLSAASEGLACLGGRAATLALQDAAVSAALIKARDAMCVAATDIDDLDGYIATAGGPATPRELLRVRWWDGALPPSFRLIMGMAPYRHLVDELGAFRGADRCPAIKRALDSTIRYNEIVDLVSDCTHQEGLNELLAALGQRGGHAVSGYGNACARAIDDALACGCVEEGHEEVAEFAMGNLLFYLQPRWGMARQVACFSSAAEPIRGGFAWREPGSRLQAVARTVLRPGDMLYSTTWQPLWSQSDASPTEATIQWAVELAARAARRCLPSGAGSDAVRCCEAAAGAAIGACDRLTTRVALWNLAEAWCTVFDAALDPAALNSESRYIADGLRPLIARIWQQTVIGDDSRSINDVDHDDDLLYIDLCSSFRRTYGLVNPDEGFRIRRAFLGVASSAIELSGVGPYNRLTDLAAHIISAPREQLECNNQN
jgi:hypothetical protein